MGETPMFITFDVSSWIKQYGTEFTKLVIGKPFKTCSTVVGEIVSCEEDGKMVVRIDDRSTLETWVASLDDIRVMGG